MTFSMLGHNAENKQMVLACFQFDFKVEAWMQQIRQRQLVGCSVA